LWDVASGRQLAAEKHLDKLYCAGISRDSRLIASGDGAGVIQLWQIPVELLDPSRRSVDATVKMKLLHSWPAHQGRAYSLLFSPEGDRLITSGADGMVKVWYVPALTGPRMLGHEEVALYDMIFMPNSHAIACAGESVTIVDLKTKRTVREFTGKYSGWRSLSCDRAGKLLAGANMHGEVRVWDAGTSESIQSWTLEGPEELRRISLSSDGRQLAVFAGRSSDSVHVFDVASGKVAGSLHDQLSEGAVVRFSPDSTQVATVSGSHMYLLDTRTWEKSKFQSIHGLTVCDCAYSPNGSLLATASSDRLVKLWNSTTGMHVGTLSGHRSAISSLAFTVDGRSLVSADRDGVVKIWNVAAGEELFELYHHGNNLIRTCISSDSRYLACLTTQNTVLLFDLAEPTGQASHASPSAE
jgi:WD40 repeat protein